MYSNDFLILSDMLSEMYWYIWMVFHLLSYINILVLPILTKFIHDTPTQLDFVFSTN